MTFYGRMRHSSGRAWNARDVGAQADFFDFVTGKAITLPIRLGRNVELAGMKPWGL